MQEQFSRTICMIGEDGFYKLQNSKIAVFGLGGVGGYTVEALVRSGISNIDLIDNDTVSLSNLNRQIIALQSTIGMPKVDVVEKRILDINPNAQIGKFQIFFTPDTSTKFDFSQYDYVVDAIDTVRGKIELVKMANETNTPIISSMGAGNKMNPQMFEISDIYKTSVCPLARVMRQELKKRGIKKLKVVYSKELPVVTDCKDDGKRVPASNAFTPAVAGLIIASEVIKDLIGYNSCK